MNDTPPLRRLPNGEQVLAWPRRPLMWRLLDWAVRRFCTRYTAGGILLVVTVVVIAEVMTHAKGER